MSRHDRPLEALIGAVPTKRIRGKADGGREATPTRDRLNMASAELQEMRLAALRGEFLARAVVVEGWQNILRQVRAGVLAAPSRIRSRLPHLNNHDVSVIDSVLRDVLTELATGAEPPDSGEEPA